MGWDLGGAHLKVALADTLGRLHRLDQLATPLWRGLDWLNDAVDTVQGRFPVGEARHALTMTGELVDLFQSRGEGVQALASLMARRLGGLELQLYAGPRGFIATDQAASQSRFIASANWHATAAFLGRHARDGLLVDVGSTTTDLVPFAAGRVHNRGYTDRERLACEELVYTGVARTPLMSLTETVPLGGEWIGLAAEHFATTADIYRLLGWLPAHADMADTADGRGKTAAESAGRLARMVGEDAQDREPTAWCALARYLADRQLERIGRACARQLSASVAPDAPLVGAGIGRFLVRRLARRLDRRYIDINDWFSSVADAAGVDAGDCAPAAAVAVLAATEELRHVPAQ
jgi:probable H4MPT-linked C1 transfer pathway protein